MMRYKQPMHPIAGLSLLGYLLLKLHRYVWLAARVEAP